MRLSILIRWISIVKTLDGIQKAQLLSGYKVVMKSCGSGLFGVYVVYLVCYPNSTSSHTRSTLVNSFGQELPLGEQCARIAHPVMRRISDDIRA